MTTSDAANAVEREVRIAARPETVFAYFTDPQKLLRWKGIEAELEPRPGGIYRVKLNDRNVIRGQYLEVTPFSRVVFTWGWECESHPIPPGASTVEVTLVPDGDGTLLKLRHGDLPEAARPNHGVGWDHYLARLAVAAGGGDPGADPWLDGPPTAD